MALLPFDDRDGFIFLDGKIIPWREAQTHVLTHALHYSSSVFEGERCYNGNIFKSEQHSERLINSANLVRIPMEMSVADIENAKREALEANGFKDAYVRAFAYLGGEQMGIDTSKCVTHFAVACWTDWISYFDPEERKKGLTLATVPTRRPPPMCMKVHSKSAGNYQMSIIAKREAQELGAYDALMLDWEGFVAESSGANIFMIKDGEIITPNPDRFLNGITRQTVIEMVKTMGYSVDESRRITPEELFTADQVFLTGSAAEVSLVSRIIHEGEEHNFAVGGDAQRIAESYTDLVNGQS